MGNIHGKTTAVLIDKYDMSTYLNMLDLGRAMGLDDVTTFSASSAVADSFLPTIRSGSIKAGGFYDDTATSGPDARFDAQQDGAGYNFTAGLALTTLGNPAYLALLRQMKYDTKSSLTQATSFSIDGKPDSTSVERAYFLHSKEAAETNGGAVTYTGTPVYTSVVSATTPTATAYTAHLHVTAGSVLSSVLVRIQSSTDTTNGVNGSWATLASFTATSATTSQRLTGTCSLSSTLPQQIWLRALIVSGTYTSITFAVAAALKLI